MKVMAKLLFIAITLLLINAGWATNTVNSSSVSTSNPSAIASINPTNNSNVSSTLGSVPTGNSPGLPIITPTSPSVDAAAYVLMDAQSGNVIVQKNMNDRRPPASLTKLMTLYVISSALANGQIKLTDTVRIGKDAWSTGGSRMFLKLGSDVAVQDLILGIIIASGNDACVAMADYVGGSQSSFVSLMNDAAKRLGMNDTHYTDPTGLPDPEHYSTAYNLALLARAIIMDFPNDYQWYKQKWITWNGIRQPNRNRLLWRDPYIDGMKTGHTNDAGYCLIASGEINGMRLISVVLGASSDSARMDDSQALLTYGFRFFETHKLYAAQATLAEPRVWLGQDKNIAVGLQNDLYVTIPKGTYDKLKATIELNSHLKAPIAKGQVVGDVSITLSGAPLMKTPLIALEADPLGGIWSRLRDHISLFFSHWFG